MTAPVVTFNGESLRTLDDAALLQLMLRDDLPEYLNTLYGNEADRRMRYSTPELQASLYDQAVTR